MAGEMVTFTLKQLQDIQVSLIHLLEAKLEVRISYRLTKFSKKIKDELTDLEEHRQKLVRKYGEPDPKDDSSLRVKPALNDAFKADMDVILAESVEIPVTKVSLADIEKASLSVIDVANLDFMIEEPKSE